MGWGGGPMDSNVSNIRSNPLSRVSTERHVTNNCMGKKRLHLMGIKETLCDCIMSNSH